MTLRSMTGFGRAVVDAGDVRIVSEVRSVNHKGLDVKARLPHGAAALEPTVIAAVKGAFERGRVDVAVEVSAAADSGALAASVRTAVEGARALAASLGVPGDVGAGDVFRALLAHHGEPEVDVDALGKDIDRAVVAAVAACARAREDEGRALAAVVAARFDAVGALGVKLRSLLGGAPARLAEKLRARVEAAGIAVDGARLAQEAALLADRVDVAEELDRLHAHVEHGRALASGRKLDFLCQELLREANTIGSKCQDAAAAHLVVELKSEIERLREQVQNIE